MKTQIIRQLSNLFGFRTLIKIIVFESDDWGSLRIPSLYALNELKKNNIDLTSGDSLRYNENDGLATASDLSTLFEVLESKKDRHGHSTVFTPISIMANPDFKRIKESNFQEYHYELFTETLKRFSGCEDSFSLWKEGVMKKLFVPQFHGREHLNVQVWMKALRENDRETRIAFDLGCWGYNNKHPKNISYQAAFDLENQNELEYQKNVIISGLQIFKSLFGYNASYFVPPNGPLNFALEETASEAEIKYLFSSKIHSEPIGKGVYKKRIRIPGQKNQFGQIYMTRNCFFEPSLAGKDWLNSCLFEIETAFRWHKPAVISTHRVNYISALNPANRDNGIRQLNMLLKEIVKRWPDAEFMTSSELGDLIAKK